MTDHSARSCFRFSLRSLLVVLAASLLCAAKNSADTRGEVGLQGDRPPGPAR